MLKKNNGITLIALVITIIVLLILAGVSIAMLTGDNGVLTRASSAKVSNYIGEIKDQISLIAADTMTDYYEEVYVNPKEAEKDGAGNVITPASDTKYTDTTVDNKIVAAITTAVSEGSLKTYADNGATITAAKGNDKIVIQYQGYEVLGTVSNAKVTWKPITKLP